MNKKDKQFQEGSKARKNFEDAVMALFKAQKPPKHEPQKRKRKGKD
jgi:hypothetical protein